MLFFNVFKGLVALVFVALPAVNAAYPPPGPCFGACWAHDPALYQASDGTYYRFTTGGLIGIQIANAIQGPWALNGSALGSKSIIDMKGNDYLWAPDIHWAYGTYYLYYSVSIYASRNSAIGVATSPSMKPGTWTDHGATGLFSRQGDHYNAIDANVLFDQRATYMNFGSYGTGISQVQMSSPTQAFGTPHNIAFNRTSRTGAMEGAFMYKTGGYYFLFWSAGRCCGYDKSRPAPGDEYRIMVCRSSNPTGFFTDFRGRACSSGGGTEVLASHDYVYGPGGQGVYYDRQYGHVLYYHYVDRRVGYADGSKRFGWNVLDFRTGWPVARSAIIISSF